MKLKSSFSFSLVVFSLSLVSCAGSGVASGGSVGAGYSGQKQGRSLKSAGGLGSSCSAGDENHICLALKYAVYNDEYGNSVVNESEIAQDIYGINQDWNQCNLEFQVEKYVAVNPKKYALNYSTAQDDELYGIRNTLSDDSTLLVVTTGKWDRSGSLGYTAANAWTSMPGEGPYGAVLEQPVGTFSHIIAHELGHYLNLLHVNDASDLMNPIIYGNSTGLSSQQCQVARTAAFSYWKNMIR